MEAEMRSLRCPSIIRDRLSYVTLLAAEANIGNLKMKIEKNSRAAMGVEEEEEEAESSIFIAAIAFCSLLIYMSERANHVKHSDINKIAISVNSFGSFLFLFFNFCKADY